MCIMYLKIFRDSAVVNWSWNISTYSLAESTTLLRVDRSTMSVPTFRDYTYYINN